LAQCYDKVNCGDNAKKIIQVDASPETPSSLLHGSSYGRLDPAQNNSCNLYKKEKPV